LTRCRRQRHLLELCDAQKRLSNDITYPSIATMGRFELDAVEKWLKAEKVVEGSGDAVEGRGAKGRATRSQGATQVAEKDKEEVVLGGQYKGTGATRIKGTIYIEVSGHFDEFDRATLRSLFRG